MPQSITKGAFFNLTGSAISAVLLLVFNIIAARTLGPEGYGLLSILYSLILTITVLLSRGTRDTVVKFTSQYEALEKRAQIFNTMKNGFKATIILIIIFVISVLALHNLIKTEFLDQDNVLFIIFIIGVMLFVLVEFVMSIFQGFREFKANAIIIVTERFLMCFFLALALLILKSGIRGGSANFITAPLVTLFLGLLLMQQLKKRYTISQERFDSRTFLHFMIPATIIGFLSIFMFRSGPLIIKTLGGIEANKIAGLFSSAFALISPVRMVIMALLESLFPHLTRVEAAKDAKLMKTYIQKSTLFVIAIAIIIIVGFYFLGPVIIHIVYGRNFIIAGYHYFFIAVFISFYLIALFLTRIILAKGHASLASLCWGMSIVVLILFVVFTPFDILLRTELGLSIANFFVVVLMFLVLQTKMIANIRV